MWNVQTRTFLDRPAVTECIAAQPHYSWLCHPWCVIAGLSRQRNHEHCGEQWARNHWQLVWIQCTEMSSTQHAHCQTVPLSWWVEFPADTSCVVISQNSASYNVRVVSYSVISCLVQDPAQFRAYSLVALSCLLYLCCYFSSCGEEAKKKSTRPLTCHDVIVVVAWPHKAVFIMPCVRLYMSRIC